MLAVYEKIMDSRDVKTLSGFIDYAMGNIETNMRPEKMFLFAVIISNNNALCINQGRVPADDTWKYASKDGKSVLVIDFEKNKEYLYSGLYMD